MGIRQHISLFIDDKPAPFNHDFVIVISANPHDAFSNNIDIYLRQDRARAKEPSHCEMHDER